MEGKTVQQLLVATGHGYDAVREHLSGVAPHLLKEFQDLHDRTGNCLPRLSRDIVLAGGYRGAGSTPPCRRATVAGSIPSQGRVRGGARNTRAPNTADVLIRSREHRFCGSDFEK